MIRSDTEIYTDIIIKKIGDKDQSMNKVIYAYSTHPHYYHQYSK